MTNRQDSWINRWTHLLSQYEGLKKLTFEVLSCTNQDFHMFMKRVLQSQPSCLSADQQQQFLQEQIFLPGHSSQQVWDEAMKFCHLLQYQLLSRIISKSGIEELKVKLKEFSAHLISLLSSVARMEPKMMRMILNKLYPVSSHSQLGGIKVITTLPSCLVDLHSFCQNLSRSSGLPFFVGPLLSPTTPMLTWLAPTQAHSALLEWQLLSEGTNKEVANLVIDDEEYWQNKSMTNTTHLAAPFNVGTMLQRLINSSHLKTLTDVCLAFVCQYVAGSTEESSYALSIPRDLLLSLCYLGKLAYENIVLSPFPSQKLVRFSNQSYRVLLSDPLFYQFLAAFFVTSDKLPSGSKVRRVQRISIQFRGYMPYFIVGILKKTCTLHKKLPLNRELVLFEMQNSDQITHHFQARAEKESVEATSGYLLSCLSQIAATMEMTSSHTASGSFSLDTMLREFAGYVTGGLLAHSNSSWLIDSPLMTYSLVRGALAFCDLRIPPHVDLLEINISICSESELNFFSHLPPIMLAKAQQVIISNVSMAETSLKALERLLVLKNVPSNIKLCLQRCLISENSLSNKFKSVLEQFDFLHYLNMSNCVLNSHIVTAVAELVRNSTHLKQLSFSNNNVEEAGATEVLISIAASTSLSVVEYSETVSTQNANLLFFRLRHNQHTMISILNLSKCSLTHHVADELSQFVRGSRQLHSLILHGNNIEVQFLISLAKGIKDCKSLQLLDVGRNAFGDEGCLALSQALHHNTSLTELHMAETCTGSTGLARLAVSLRQNINTHLSVLDLSRNVIGDKGAKDLRELLLFNTSLQWLQLRDNQIGRSGAMSLASALETHNHTLRHLDLRKNQIDSQTKKTLKEVASNRLNVLL